MQAWIRFQQESSIQYWKDKRDLSNFYFFALVSLSFRVLTSASSVFRGFDLSIVRKNCGKNWFMRQVAGGNAAVRAQQMGSPSCSPFHRPSASMCKADGMVRRMGFTDSHKNVKVRNAFRRRAPFWWWRYQHHQYVAGPSRMQLKVNLNQVEKQKGFGRRDIARAKTGHRCGFVGNCTAGGGLIAVAVKRKRFMALHLSDRLNSVRGGRSGCSSGMPCDESMARTAKARSYVAYGVMGSAEPRSAIACSYHGGPSACIEKQWQPCSGRAGIRGFERFHGPWPGGVKTTHLATEHRG